MNQLARYIIIGTIVSIVLFLLWYFSSIVAYILVSALLGLVGKPIVDIVCKIKIWRWKPTRTIGAAIALIAIWALFFTFFRIIIPLVVSQANELSSVNVQLMVENFSKPIELVEAFIRDYLPASAREFSVKNFFIDRVSNVFDVGMIASFFSSTANLVVNLFIAFFSVSFITFFFLKDDSLFFEGIKILFPEKFEQQIEHALISINKLLRRYFIGIIIESTLIMILNTIGLTFIGVKLETAVVMGLIAGVLNVVPYVGPLAGTIIGVLIGIGTNLELDFATQLLPLIIYMIIVFLTTQVVDNVLFQPLIYSSSVNAHPLEIFIVLLVAGNVAGILGMLLAIPSYTVLRVFAKEFFIKFRVVKKLTEKI